MKRIYNLFLIAAIAMCHTSCNNEWEDEQFKQLVSFKATINSEGVSPTYVRYKPDGLVTYHLPLILSGSTMNTNDKNVGVSVDVDTLNTLNLERFGERRKELYFHELDKQYYSMPETVNIPAGQCIATLPISFTLGGENGANPLDMSDKYILPLTIMDSPNGSYQANDRLHYRKALLNIIPFNDYSGTYDGSQFKITLDGQKDPFTVKDNKAYVHNDNTVFVYMGLRNVDYTDRKYYKMYMEFTGENITPLKYKLRLWTDNGDSNGNNFKVLEGKVGNVEYEQPYYTIVEENDPVKPYLKHIYITLSLAYTFEDYTLSPGNRLKYTVEGTLNMQRDLNTLIPDEDQQIQWD